MPADTSFNAAANTRPQDRPEPEALWQEISWGRDIGKVRALLDADPESLHQPVRFCEHYVSGDLAIHIACRYGQAATVDLLLSRGAGLEALNKSEGATPLFAAAQASQFAVMDLLLNKGANIETRDKNDCTPLWYAARGGHIRTVEYLLAHGANSEAPGPGDLTPLVVALQGKNTAAALALVGHGADTTARDAAAATAFDIAGRDAPEVYSLMLEKERERAAAAKAALRADIDRTTHEGVDMRGKLKAPLQFVKRKPTS